MGRDAFRILEPNRVRYVVIHMDTFDAPGRDDLINRLSKYGEFLRRRYADDRAWLYEIVAFPG